MFREAVGDVEAAREDQVQPTERQVGVDEDEDEEGDDAPSNGRLTVLLLLLLRAERLLELGQERAVAAVERSSEGQLSASSRFRGGEAECRLLARWGGLSDGRGPWTHLVKRFCGLDGGAAPFLGATTG